MAAVPKKMIERRFVFGVQQDVKDGCQYIDENTIVWTAGNNVVIYNMQYGTQKFIPASETCEEITAMAISANRRSLAVAEAGETPAIAIYDPQTRKRKRFLSVPELQSREYVCLSFAQTGPYLAAQGGKPEWHLVLWNVDKSKAIAMVQVNDRGNPIQDKRLINQCSISPRDPNLICVSGNGIFKFYRYDASATQHPLQLKSASLGKTEPMNYLAHVWLPPEDRLIVSTDNGDLLLVENGEYKHQLPMSPSDGLSIDTLAATNKGGFICGGDMGLLTLFERSEDKDLFRKSRTMKVDTEKRESDSLVAAEDSVKILAFSITPPPSEEWVSILTSNKQLFLMNLSNADFTNKADDRITDVVSQPFHAGPITGLDICIRKPLLVTCGKDRNVFLWNYLSNSVEVSKHFNNEVLSVAIHPSGLHLLVGFPDKLRFMNVYGDDIREFRSFSIRSCSACKFSNGGQFFAAMHSTIIHVYFTYTCDLMTHLRAHSGKIKSLYFCPPDDTRLLSAGADGNVYEWSLTDNFKKEREFKNTQMTFHSITADDQSVWASSSDRKLRHIDRQQYLPQGIYDLKNCSAICLTQSIGLKLLFAGCEDGTVRVFNTYKAEKNAAERGQITSSASPDGGTDPSEQKAKNDKKHDILLESHPANCGHVCHIAMTFDESVVATVGEDGVLTLWDVVAEHRTARKEITFAEEILIDKKDLEERNKVISDLHIKVEELKQKIEHQKVKSAVRHAEKLAQLQEFHAEARKNQQKLLDDLKAEKDEQDAKFNQHCQDMEKRHQEDLKKITAEYKTKIESLQERKKTLMEEAKQQAIEFQIQQKEKQDQKAAAEAEQKRSHEEQKRDLQNQIAALEQANKDATDYAQTVQDVIEADTDEMIMTEKERYGIRMKDEELQFTTLEGNNAIIQVSVEQSKNECDNMNNKIRDQIETNHTLEVNIASLERDVAALEVEKRERMATVEEKEKRIYDLRKKNEELGKFKFVLEYKITELEEQIIPRDKEIAETNAKLAEMDVEAEKYNRSNEALVLEIRGKKLKLDGHSKEIDNLRARLQEAAEFQTQLWTELTDLYQEENPRKTKEMTKALYYRHTSTSQHTKLAQAKVSDDAQREYNRNRDYLQRSVAGLRTKLIKDGDTNRADRSRIVGENVTLIKEINELRREVRTLHLQKRGVAATAQRDEAQRELEMQRNELQRLRHRAEELERQLHAAGKPTSVPGAPMLS